MNFRRLFQKFAPKVSEQEIFAREQEIVARISPWMLSCAVGVSRGEWTKSSLTFDSWFSCCETTWVGELAKNISVSSDEIKHALERFVSANRNKTSEAVLREISERRGVPMGITLKPGESVELNVRL